MRYFVEGSQILQGDAQFLFTCYMHSAQQGTGEALSEAMQQVFGG